MAIEKPITIPIPWKGLIRSVNREQIPPDGCSELENWLHRQNEFVVRPGLIAVGQDTDQRPTNFIQYDHNDGSSRTVMGTTAGWFRFNTATTLWNSLTGGVPLTASVQQQVFRVFPKAGVNWLLGCNGVDPMKKWDGTSASYTNVGGSPPNARAMMKLFDRIILLGLKSGANAHPAAIDVSDNKDFDAGWGVNQFGPLRDCDGEIIGGEEFGSDIGVIYASDGIHLAISDGGSAPFRFELKTRLARDQGLAATLALTRTGRGTHVYLAKDGTLKEFDLAGISQWGSKDLEKYLNDVLNPTTIGRAWMSYNPTHGEILIMYPEKGNVEPNAGVLVKEHPPYPFTPIRFSNRQFSGGAFLKMDRSLTLGDLPVTLGSLTQTLGELTATVRNFFFGDVGGVTFENTGTDDTGSPISAFFETGLNSLGNETQNKTVKHIEHRFSRAVGPQAVTVKIGKSKYGNDRTLSNAKILQIGDAGPYTTGHRITSRFLSIRVEVQATKRVNWLGSSVSAVPRGFR